MAVNYRFDENGANEVVAGDRSGRRAGHRDPGRCLRNRRTLPGSSIVPSTSWAGSTSWSTTRGSRTTASIFDLEPDGWLDVMSVNFGGVVNSTQAAMEHFMSARDGAVVNISSVAADRASVGTAIYGASKAAINAFTRSAALELARFGVRVNGIAPGLIDTKLVAAVDLVRSTPMREQVPLGVYGDPEDVAHLAVFLCSREARYITGAILTMDGGLTTTVDTRVPWRPGSGGIRNRAPAEQTGSRR